jgi:membrane protein DedA with SNARE-associated domain
MSTGLAIIFEFTPINLIGFLLHVPLFIWLGIVLWRMPEPAVVRMSPAAIS